MRDQGRYFKIVGPGGVVLKSEIIWGPLVNLLQFGLRLNDSGVNPITGRTIIGVHCTSQCVQWTSMGV